MEPSSEPIAYARRGTEFHEPARRRAGVVWCLALPLVGLAVINLARHGVTPGSYMLELDVLLLTGLSAPATITAILLAAVAVATLLLHDGPRTRHTFVAAAVVVACLLGPLLIRVIFPSYEVRETVFVENPMARFYPEAPRWERAGTTSTRSPLTQGQTLLVGTVALAGHVLACLFAARGTVTLLGRQAHHIAIGCLGALFFLSLAVDELHQAVRLIAIHLDLRSLSSASHISADRFVRFSIRHSDPAYIALFWFTVAGTLAGVLWALLVPGTFLAESTARTNRRFREYREARMQAGSGS